MKEEKKAYLILHDIRSNQNVGSLFRTADAVGISKIFLTGYTPAPLDKYERPVKEIAKTALGAEKIIPWVKTSIEECFGELRNESVQTIAIEQGEHSISYREVKVESTVAFILGNEVTGIPEEILNLCDVVAEIPMAGEKESLNVSVAGGIALFQMLGK